MCRSIQRNRLREASGSDKKAVSYHITKRQLKQFEAKTPLRKLKKTEFTGDKQQYAQRMAIIRSYRAMEE
ncbi:hypothetical protein AVEN_95567-1, partial [Araneus ventricosus]